MNFKKILPYLLCLMAFIIAPLFYFKPLLKGGQELLQPDIVNFAGGAKEMKDYKAETGKSTYWTNSSFSGMPTYQFGAEYDYDVIKYIDSAFQFLPRPAGYIFMMLLSFFLLMHALAVDWKTALMGAFFFAFSTYFFIIIAAGHNAKVHALAYLPGIIAGIIYLYRKKYFVGFVLTLLFMALQIKANHVQMTYYMGLMLIVFGIVEAIQAYKNKTYKDFAIASILSVLALGLGLGVNASRTLTTMEYAKYSNRSGSELKTLNSKDATEDGMNREDIFRWSYGVGESFNLMLPNLYGGGSEKTVSYSGGEASAYWGEQPITAPAYQGVVVMFLFILGMFTVKSHHKWWLFGASMLSLMLAWGHNFPAFNNFMVDYFPMYAKWRAVTSVLIIFEFCAPVLAALAVWQFIKESSPEQLKKLKYVTMGVIGILVVTLLLANTLFDFVSSWDLKNPEIMNNIDAIKTQRYNLLRGDIMKSILLISLAFGALFITQKEKITIPYKNTIAVLALLVIGVGDLWVVDKEYLNDTNFVDSMYTDNPYPTEVSDRMIEDMSVRPKLQSLLGQQLVANEPIFANVEINKALEKLKKNDPSNYRVFNTIMGPMSEAHTSYFHNSLGGYFAVKLRRYQELFDHQMEKGNMQVFNMLNTKYVLEYNPEAKTLDSLFLPKLNPQANGNAWLVKDIVVANSADEEMQQLSKINTKIQAIVRKEDVSKIKTQYTSFQGDTIQLIPNAKLEPQYLQYQSQAQNPRLAVFSEIDYPGWNAYIDGKKAQNLRVNYVLRALEIPAGKHNIEFKFEPTIVETAKTVNIICYVIVLLVIAVMYWLFGRKELSYNKPITHNS